MPSSRMSMRMRLPEISMLSAKVGQLPSTVYAMRVSAQAAPETAKQQRAARYFMGRKYRFDPVYAGRAMVGEPPAHGG